MKKGKISQEKSNLLKVIIKIICKTCNDTSDSENKNLKNFKCSACGSSNAELKEDDKKI